MNGCDVKLEWPTGLFLFNLNMKKCNELKISFSIGCFGDSLKKLFFPRNGLETMLSKFFF